VCLHILGFGNAHLQDGHLTNLHHLPCYPQVCYVLPGTDAKYCSQCVCRSVQMYKHFIKFSVHVPVPMAWSFCGGIEVCYVVRVLRMRMFAHNQPCHAKIKLIQHILKMTHQWMLGAKLLPTTSLLWMQTFLQVIARASLKTISVIQSNGHSEECIPPSCHITKLAQCH